MGVLLAKRHGWEILSADSMSIYRGMDIGTAKPSLMEREGVPHHGIDLVDPSEGFDTARFVAFADGVIAEANARHKDILVVGGTPLYLMALLKGFFEGPEADPALREALREREREEEGFLHARLSEVDPLAAQRIHRNDTKRLVRALEVFEKTGTPISELQQQFEEGEDRYPYLGARILLSRDSLRERVRERSKKMLDHGLVDEVRRIRDEEGFGPTSEVAIGYREVLAFLDGKLPTEELIYRIRSNTHRLVRRQDTWLRTFPGLQTVKGEGISEEEILYCLESILLPRIPKL
jgi:tRNA dimethylallyltransferase